MSRGLGDVYKRQGQTGEVRTPDSDSLPSEDEPGGAAVDCHTKGKKTDSLATGAASLSSSLLLSGSSNSSADVHDGGSHNPPSDMFMADTAANSHIIDSDDMASGGNGTGSHSEAQDGTDGGRVTPGHRLGRSGSAGCGFEWYSVVVG